jgi:DNA-binding Xre family transcriptional regulator
MSGTRHLAYSRLSRILTAQQSTVADLCKKLSEKGILFDRKTVYRLAGFKPLQTINAPILGAVCEALNVGVGDVIGWEPSKPELHRIDDKTQERLSLLMGRSNEGELTDSEARELAELGNYAEKLSLENARILADVAAAAKRCRPAARRTGRLTTIRTSPKSRRKVEA